MCYYDDSFDPDDMRYGSYDPDDGMYYGGKLVYDDPTDDDVAYDIEMNNAGVNVEVSPGFYYTFKPICDAIQLKGGNKND